MVKLIWRFSGKLFYLVFFLENLGLILPQNLKKKYHSPHFLNTISILTILVIRLITLFLHIMEETYFLQCMHKEESQ